MADDWAAFRIQNEPAPSAGEGAPGGTPWSKFRTSVASGAPDGSHTPEGATRITIRPPPRPDQGRVDAVGRGVAQGATAGFSDEIRGLIEAGGANPDEPASVYKLMHGALKYWGGDTEAKKRYHETVAREREANKGAAENHAGLYGLGEVGGTIATLPLGGAASKAATWTGRAASAAKQGAVYGGLAGAGEGEGAADTAIKGAGGAVLGGVVGGVAAPLIEGGANLIKKGTEKLRNTVRGALDPESEAARQYLTALDHDRINDPNFQSRMTPAEFHATPEARLMDLGGGTVRRLADVAGITSPGGEMKLKQVIDDRFKGQSGRMSDWFRSNFHYPDAYQQGQALDEVAKNVNRPAYKKAYQEGDRQIMSPELERLMGSPKVVEAMRVASTSGKDRAVTEGFGAFNPGVTVENGMVKFRAGKNGVPTYPNLQFWDQTRRELSDAAKKAARSGGTEEAGVLGNLAKQMNAELDKHVPSYQAARQGAAHFFGAEDALDAGKKFVTSDKVSISEARDRLAKMSPAERRLFTDGFVSDYVDKVINSTGDRRDVMLKIAQNPQARAKLELVMGRHKMNELEAKMRVEGILDDVRKSIQGQSITAKRLYDLGMAGGAGLGAHGAYDTDPKEIAYGALIGALSSGGKRINANVATKLVGMLTSRDPAVVQKGFKALSGNSRTMSALRDADTTIGRVVGSRAPVNQLLDLTGATRADDQKPGVPGPRPKQ